MKKSLLFLPLLLLLALFTNAQNLSFDGPKIISYSLWKTVPSEELKAEMKKNKVPKALVNVKYTVDIYDVVYKTCWHDGTCIKASGLYFVPRGVDKPMPTTVYHHGTRVHAGRDKDLGGEDYLCLGLAVEGYTVLQPDYVGLGHGDKFHLYQLAKPLGQTSVDMLYAIRELNDTLGIKVSDKLFLTGYSEGGYATLATNKLIQEQYSKDFKVTAASGMSGAYDMGGVQSTVMFKPYDHPHYLPYLLRAVNEVYKIVPYDINNIYKAPYDTIIPKMFDGKHSLHAINEALPKIPKDMIIDSIINVYVKDPEFPLHKVLRENSLCYWKPENPVQLCYCDKDEQVTYKNAFVARDEMKKLGAEHVTLRRGGKKYGHYKCAIFSGMYTKLYFDSFLKGSKYGRKGNVNKRFILSLAKLAIKP
jgi:hypothetical protein